MACLQTKHTLSPLVDSPPAGISPGILFRILLPVVLLALLIPAAFSQDVVKDSLNSASPAAVPLREASGLKATAAAAMADEEETTETDEADAMAASEVDDDEETQSEKEDASEESEEDAKKERSKKEKKKPSVFGSGMAYGNILLTRKFDEDTGFLFVLGNQRSVPRRSYYLDKRTKFYKVEDRERTKITRAELVDGERVVISYIFQDKTYLADEVFMVIGDFHPPDYLPRSKRKRRKRS